MDKRLVTYIGFAIKKGSVTYGADKLTEKGSRTHADVVLMGFDAGKNTVKMTVKHCLEKKIPLYVTNEQPLSVYCNRQCKVIAITDRNLASAVVKTIEETAGKDFIIYTEVQPIDNNK
ncbi:MAG: hypothetical protein RR054_02840 [Clostridia bacterium]